MRITDKHEAFYREHGYAIVENFCTPSELQDALQNFDKVVPGWVDFANNPSGPKPPYYDKPFPDQPGIPHFPYPENALNDLTFQPELRRFATLMGDGEEMYCERYCQVNFSKPPKFQEFLLYHRCIFPRCKRTQSKISIGFCCN